MNRRACHRRSPLPRWVTTCRDALSAPLPGALVAALLLLLVKGLRDHPDEPRCATEPPALVSLTQTNGPLFRHRYPQGQFQADLHTLLNMMRYVLTPEPLDPTRASTASALPS